MQLIILAGGSGTRLKSVSGDLPKPLVSVLGIPLLGRQLQQAAGQGVVDEALVLTGYGADQIASYIAGQDFGIPVRCLAEPVARGTAGAVFEALPHLKPEFFVMYADTVNDVDLARFLSFHRAHGVDASLFLHPNDHPFDSDLVTVDEAGRILAFHPSPHPPAEPLPNLVNAAFYVLRRDALLGLAGLPEKPDFGKHVFPAMLREGRRLAGYCSPEYIKDAGTPKRLAKVAADIESGLAASRSFRTPAAAVFMDRDGVLNVLDGHINTAEKMQMLPGAAQAVARLNHSLFRTVVVTNQPVVARGEASFETLRHIHAKLDTELGAEGAYLDALYFCPHHPDRGFPREIVALKVDCTCRKPGTGMVERASRELNIDLERSWMIGDTTSDMEMARRAGLRAILVYTGEGGADGKYDARPEFVADDLAGAVEIIFRHDPRMFAMADSSENAFSGVKR
jgi:histidinol-phosphate phosphatase family protein